jgi:hypothetical protein
MPTVESLDDRGEELSRQGLLRSESRRERRPEPVEHLEPRRRFFVDDVCVRDLCPGREDQLGVRCAALAVARACGREKRRREGEREGGEADPHRAKVAAPTLAVSGWVRHPGSRPQTTALALTAGGLKSGLRLDTFARTERSCGVFDDTIRCVTEHG